MTKATFLFSHDSTQVTCRETGDIYQLVPTSDRQSLDVRVLRAAEYELRPVAFAQRRYALEAIEADAIAMIARAHNLATARRLRHC